MPYRAALEDMEPDHWIVWLLDLPGCYSSAKTSAEALSRAPARVAEYYHWVFLHDALLPAPQAPPEVEVVETFHSFPSRRDPEYIVNAFFEDDKRPLGYWEVVVARQLLDWSHADLLRVIEPVDEQQLDRTIEGEARQSLRGIVDHIAGAENWYLGMLGLGLDQAALPQQPLHKIEAVRRHTKAQLWSLVGQSRTAENYDEIWSGRKVLRRALWHERDHTQHIRQLLRQM